MTTGAFDRETALRTLGETPFDVVIIGGGITGVGCALDAAARGLRTALVEKGDFACFYTGFADVLLELRKNPDPQIVSNSCCGLDGRDEALVSILDEPFAALSHGTSVPRYLVHVFSDCELMLHIEEVTRYAMNTPATSGEISVGSHENE